jgi:predicted nucleotidyltransferase
MCIEGVTPSMRISTLHESPGEQPGGIVQKLRHIAPGIRSQFGVKNIGIFGSYARGDQTSTSDVDILIDLDEQYKTLRNFIALADYLENFFKQKIDLVTIEGIDPYIRSRVEAEVIWIEG